MFTASRGGLWCGERAAVSSSWLWLEVSCLERALLYVGVSFLLCEALLSGLVPVAGTLGACLKTTLEMLAPCVI